MESHGILRSLDSVVDSGAQLMSEWRAPACQHYKRPEQKTHWFWCFNIHLYSCKFSRTTREALVFFVGDFVKGFVIEGLGVSRRKSGVGSGSLVVN